MAALDASGIRYLIVGGIAAGFHGVPRYTKALDVLVQSYEPLNKQLYDCLEGFGAPVEILTPDELKQDDFVFHFGSPPWRVDILTSIPGVDFDSAYEDRVELPLGEYKATCISIQWLIPARKLAAGPRICWMSSRSAEQVSGSILLSR